MLIEIPSQFRAEYVRPKKRSVEAAILRTMVEVEIREIDSVDAPLAHIVGERREEKGEDLRPDFVPFEISDGRPSEVRIIDGVFYVRRMTAEKFAEVSALADWANPFSGYYSDGSAHILAGPCFAAYSWQGEVRHDDLPWDREGFESTAGETMRKWEDQRHVTVAALVARAAHFAVVDGEIYERVGEPALTLSMDGERVSLHVTEVVAERDGFSRGSGAYHSRSCIRFGIDEMFRAIAEGERIAAEEGVPFVNLSEVMQHSPWHVRFRGEPELVAERGWGLLEALTPHVTAFSPILGKAWYDLSVALHENPGCSLPAIDAMRRIVAMEEEIKHGIERADGSYGYGGMAAQSGLLSKLKGAETAIHMWDTRDTAGIVWTGEGLGATATHEGRMRAWEVTDLMEADRIEAAFGKDVSHLIASATEGRVSLVAVEENRVVRTLCAVDTSEDGPRVADAVASHGAEPSQKHLELAVGHVEHALVSGARPGIEQELAAFGI